MSEKRYLVKGYGVAPNGENIFGIFDSRTKSPYYLYAFNDDGLNKIARIMNEQQSTINRQSEQHKQILNELINENSELRMKIVSLENEIQRQNNELKNTRKEFIKKTDERNWLKSEDYLKKIY